MYFSQVEALAVKLTQNEGELIQEKFEVKKLLNFLKQVFFDIFTFCKWLYNLHQNFLLTIMIYWNIF